MGVVYEAFDEERRDVIAAPIGVTRLDAKLED
jgi:hypothetical protein